MSTYYPIFLNIQGRKCVVVGGGEVAERKARALADQEASVTVISARVCNGLAQLAEQGTMFKKFNVTGKTCHPSRCGLLTSRTPASYPIPSVQYGFNQAQHGYLDRVTVMELMKGAGYTTTECIRPHILSSVIMIFPTILHRALREPTSAPHDRERI